MDSKDDLKKDLIGYMPIFRNEGNTYRYSRCGKVYETAIERRTFEKYACIAVELSLAVRKKAYGGSFDSAAFELLDERKSERDAHIVEFGEKYLETPEIYDIAHKASNTMDDGDETYTRLLSATPVRTCAYDIAEIFLRERMECPLRKSVFDIGAKAPSEWECARAMMLSLMTVDAVLVKK